jgi:Family of unknown function (DUF5947)
LWISPQCPHPHGAADFFVSSPLANLRKFAGTKPGEEPPRRAPVEQCELCAVRVPPQHRHLLEMPTLKIVCACDPCALRFQDVVEGRFKLIPRDTRSLPEFKITDADWENFALPINLAFLFYSTPHRKMMAYYPSPAGATESLLPLTAWSSLVAQNPSLKDMQADVQALLVNRAGKARDYFIAPIDKCFELVGTIRMHWRGLSGGHEVWDKIDSFFSQLKENA